MAGNKKPRKRRSYRQRPVTQMLSEMQISFALKRPMTFEERQELADQAYAAIDQTKTKPDFYGFSCLVEIVNILIFFVSSTDTPKKRRDRNNAPDALQWLYETTDDQYVGHIAETINRCQYALQNAMERHERTGSWALDGETLRLIEIVATWYQELTSVMPMVVLWECLQKIDRVTVHDTPKGKQCHVPFTELSNEYIEKEKTWISVDSDWC